ncbi:hypothetical protein IAU59_002074 [Kwoniella sp. CBS 9459]
MSDILQDRRQHLTGASTPTPFPSSSSNSIPLSLKRSARQPLTSRSELFRGMTFYLQEWHGKAQDPRTIEKQMILQSVGEQIRAHGGNLNDTPNDRAVTHILVITRSHQPDDEVLTILDRASREPGSFAGGKGGFYRLIRTYGGLVHTYPSKTSDSPGGGHSFGNSNCREKEEWTGEKVVLKYEWVRDCIDRGRIRGQEENWGGWRVRGKLVHEYSNRPGHGSSWRPGQSRYGLDRPPRYLSAFDPTRSGDSYYSPHVRIRGRAGSSYRPQYKDEPRSPSARSSFSESSMSERPYYSLRNRSPYDPASLPQVTWYGSPDRAGSTDSNASGRQHSTASYDPVTSASSVWATASNPPTPTSAAFPSVDMPAPIFTRSSRDSRLVSAQSRACSHSVLCTKISPDGEACQSSSSRRVVSENTTRKPAPVNDEPRPVDPRIAWRQTLQARQSASTRAVSKGQHPDKSSTEDAGIVQFQAEDPASVSTSAGNSSSNTTHLGNDRHARSTPDPRQDDPVTEGHSTTAATLSSPLRSDSPRPVPFSVTSLAIEASSDTDPVRRAHDQLQVTVAVIQSTSALELNDSDLDILTTDNEYSDEDQNENNDEDDADDWFQILDVPHGKKFHSRDSVKKPDWWNPSSHDDQAKPIVLRAASGERMKPNKKDNTHIQKSMPSISVPLICTWTRDTLHL